MDKKKVTSCDICLYYYYDYDYGDYMCQLDAEMDEDDAARTYYDQEFACPYFTAGNEYTIVKKQM